MQKVLIFVLAAATLGLAVWCGVQGRQLSVAQTQLRVEQHAREALAGEQQSQAERVRELERVNARLENQVQQFATVTTTLRTNEAVQLWLNVFRRARPELEVRAILWARAWGK
jgi:uncharacterized protein HemX